MGCGCPHQFGFCDASIIDTHNREQSSNVEHNLHTEQPYCTHREHHSLINHRFAYRIHEFAPDIYVSIALPPHDGQQWLHEKLAANTTTTRTVMYKTRATTHTHTRCMTSHKHISVHRNCGHGFHHSKAQNVDIAIRRPCVCHGCVGG